MDLSIYSLNYYTADKKTLSESEWQEVVNCDIDFPLDLLIPNYYRDPIRVRNSAKVLQHRTDIGKKESSLQKAKLSQINIPHLEIHPTDICNLNCLGCTYGKMHSAASLDLSKLIDFVSSVNCRSIVIVGGGEPSLYKNKGRTLSDLILMLRDILSVETIGLITNGTNRLATKALDKLSWIRISLDAATTGSYSLFRGKNFFLQVIDNLEYILKSNNILKVGVSYLFSKENIQEVTDTALLFYNKYFSSSEDNLGQSRFTIQYRPLRLDTNDSTNEISPSENQIRNETSKIMQAARKEYKLYRFLKENTNIETISGNIKQYQKGVQCRYILASNIVRADGSIYPCFCTVSDIQSKLGSIYSFDKDQYLIGVQKLLAGDCPHLCRNFHINEILSKTDKSLEQKVSQSAIKELSF